LQKQLTKVKKRLVIFLQPISNFSMSH